METITLEQASFLAEILGGIAVIVSLIYVGLGVRQNAQAVRLSAGQAIARELREVVSQWVSADVADIMVLGVNNLEISGAEKLRFYAIFNNLMRVMENGYYQFAAGTLDPTLWEGFKHTLADVMSSPGAKSWWAARKHWFSAEFQRYFDEDVSPGATPGYHLAGTGTP